MERYESFLFLLGSVFTPLFGVLLVDHFIVRRNRLGDTPRGFRWAAFVPWILGFIVYHWISPPPLDWWSELMSNIFGAPLSVRYEWLSASLASLVVSGLMLLLFTRSRRGGGLSSAHSNKDEVTR
jgi:purine-cytosine permease-like protein